MTPQIRTAKVNFWRAREMIGEEEAAKVWAEAHADQDEEIEFEHGYASDE